MSCPQDSEAHIMNDRGSILEPSPEQGHGSFESLHAVDGITGAQTARSVDGKCAIATKKYSAQRESEHESESHQRRLSH